MLDGIANRAVPAPSLRKARDLAGVQHPLAFGGANRELTRDDDQPLLLVELEVVRPRRLARVDVVDTQPREHRAEFSRDVPHGEPVPVRALVVRLQLELEQVEDALAHAASPA
jgi:hypothetical protein